MAVRPPAVEMLDVIDLREHYRGRRVLATVRARFKCSWLALCLAELGARVAGIARARRRARPYYWDLLGLRIDEHRPDARNPDPPLQAIATIRPSCVFHLAAQPPVRRSYADLVTAWSTNVTSTVNVLEVWPYERRH